MPVKAKTETGQWLYSFKFKNKFEFKDKNEKAFCQFCNSEMYMAQGQKTLFFKHYPSKERNCEGQGYDHHYETPEHLESKQLLYYEALEVIKELPDSENHSVQLEYPIKNCGSHGRIADIALLYKDEPWAVIECQLSGIKFETLKQRIMDYAELGIESFWHLGENANTEENRKLILKYTDYLGFINTSTSYTKNGSLFRSIYGVEDKTA